MGRLTGYLSMVDKSRLLAPNLKEMTLNVFTGNAHGGNHIARQLIRDHLVALRWMNPNAVIYLKEVKGQGTPIVDFKLWDGSAKSFEIKAKATAEEVVARVMMAARDPADDDIAEGGAVAGAGAAAPASTANVSAPFAAAAGAASASVTSAAPARAFSTLAARRSGADGCEDSSAVVEASWKLVRDESAPLR